MPLRGTVIDNKDPYQRGRCRVRVWGMHKEDDPNLPWAETMGSTMFGLHKGVGYSGVLQEGTTVWVEFEQEDLQCPIIVGVFVGHDAETMEEINPDTSDFHPDAKGPNYGHVWLMTTPGGNRLEFNDIDKRITMKTACGPELTLDCGKKQAFLTNGNASIKLDGDQILVDGHMKVSGSVVAPNLCYCGSAGTPGGGSDAANEARNERCGPIVDGDKITCNGDLPPNNGLTELQEPVRKLLEKAQEIYKEKNQAEMKVYETRMSPERYLCLSKAGVPVAKEQLYGYGVTAYPHDKNFPEAVQSPSTPGSTTPTDSNTSAATGNGALAGGIDAWLMEFEPNDKYRANAVFEWYNQNNWCKIEKAFGLPRGFLLAVSIAESGGNRCAGSGKGAKGPMQFMPETWKEQVPKYNAERSKYGGPAVNVSYNAATCTGDIFSISLSPWVSAYYYKWIYDNRHKNWPVALAGYNAGPYRSDVKAGRIPNLTETKNYVKKIGGVLRWIQENKGNLITC